MPLVFDVVVVVVVGGGGGIGYVVGGGGDGGDGEGLWMYGFPNSCTHKRTQIAVARRTFAMTASA